MRAIYAVLVILAGLFFYALSRPVSFEVVPEVMASTVDDTIKDLNAKAPRFPQKALYSPDVKVALDNGHGSGFHLTGDYWVTAGHVAAEADKSKKFELVLDDGSVRKAEVLWVNKERDIALLKADGRDVENTTLDCTVPEIGDPITLKGNPMMLDKITTYGFVSGGERPAGDWKSVYIVSANVVPGQSGGAVYNDVNHVVGVTVGVFLLPMSFSSSLTGYGAIVSGKTVCDLLARG